MKNLFRSQLLFGGAVALALILSSAPAAAHEFWLEASKYTPETGEEIEISHKTGTDFKASATPWINNWVVLSRVYEEGDSRDARGLDGDIPALKLSFDTPGLAILAHQSSASVFKANTWEKWTTYLRKEGLEEIEKRHEQSDKTRENVRELYTRFAKALFDAGGTGDGNDRNLGLKIEIVLDANPYRLEPGEGLPVTVYYLGKPLAGVLVKAFNGTGKESYAGVRTDASGKAVVPYAASGPYLLNAVHMIEPESQEARDKAVEWESFWASTTFARR